MIKTKVNKGELFERFFRGTRINDIQPEEIKKDKDNITEDSVSEPIEIGSIASGSVEFDLLQPRPTPAYRDNQGGISVRSIASEEELEEDDDLIQPDSRSSSNSEESDHSFHEEEAPPGNVPAQRTAQRKGSF